MEDLIGDFKSMRYSVLHLDVGGSYETGIEKEISVRVYANQANRLGNQRIRVNTDRDRRTVTATRIA